MLKRDVENYLYIRHKTSPDGSSPLSLFKFQFKTVGRWNEGEKTLELILTLKGVAIEILETMPTR